MRFSQLILGFERNKQGEGNNKNLSIIRLLKDRKFGRSGEVYTRYDGSTGRLFQRGEDEVDKDNPFEEYQSGAALTDSAGGERVF